MVYKASKGEKIKTYQRCQIVIASYNEVARSFPGPALDDLEAQEQWSIDEMDTGSKPAGILHQIKWLRVCYMMESRSWKTANALLVGGARRSSNV